MEGPQRLCIEACEGMCDLSTEQVRADSPRGVTASITHPKVEVGKCVDGLHHRSTKGIGHRFHICSC